MRIFAVLLVLIASQVSAQTVDTVNFGPGTNHTTLADLLADSAQDLTVANKSFVFLTNVSWAGAFEDGNVHVTGYTTDATRNIKIVAEGVARHSGAPFASQSYYRIKNTTSESRATPNFRISEAYTEVDGIIVEQGKGDTDAGDILVWLSNARQSVLKNILIVDSAAGGTTTGIRLSGNNDSVGIITCMIQGIQTGIADTGSAIRFTNGGSPDGISILNTTINNCDVNVKFDTITFGGSWPDSMTVTLANNIYKSTDDTCIWLETGSIAGGHIFNTSYDNTGATNLFITAGTFGDTANIVGGVTYSMVDAKARDFHLIDENVTGSAKGLGADLRTLGSPSSRTHVVLFDVDGDKITGINNEVGFDEIRSRREVKILK